MGEPWGAGPGLRGRAYRANVRAIERKALKRHLKKNPPPELPPREPDVWGTLTAVLVVLVLVCYGLYEGVAWIVHLV